jgi:hypothetical protein
LHLEQLADTIPPVDFCTIRVGAEWHLDNFGPLILNWAMGKNLASSPESPSLIAAEPVLFMKDTICSGWISTLAAKMANLACNPLISSSFFAFVA